MGLRGKKEDEGRRAQIIAALLAGQGVNETAREYGVVPSTVSRIKAQLNPEQVREMVARSEIEFSGLIANYLAETLTTLAAQAIHFRDEDWLKQQAAGELAVLHGVQCDKAIRLLEAIERANLPQQPEPIQTTD